MQLARRYRGRQALIGQRVQHLVAARWQQVNRRTPEASWQQLLPQALAVTAAGMRTAAAGATDYVSAALVAQGADSAPTGVVAATVFGATASDGRPLGTLLYLPALTAQQELAAGVDQAVAWQHAADQLASLVLTQVFDAGRAAVSAAVTADKGVGGYIRMLNPPSCSRCVILAGRFYRWNAGFDRHPRCDCVHVPASEDTAGDLRTSPHAYFDSLSQARQDATFGKAGAQAVRDGADLSQVVNARRGMHTATAYGHRVLATREGVTRFGHFGRSGVSEKTGGLRLMPEQIYRDAAGDRDLAIRLLQRFGYLI